MYALDRLYIGAQIRAARWKENVKEFLAGQDGVSNVVATIIILLIVVLIIGVFWKQLSKWLNQMMKTIFDFDPEAEKSTLENGLGG